MFTGISGSYTSRTRRSSHLRSATRFAVGDQARAGIALSHSLLISLSFQRRHNACQAGWRTSPATDIREPRRAAEPLDRCERTSIADSCQCAPCCETIGKRRVSARCGRHRLRHKVGRGDADRTAACLKACIGNRPVLAVASPTPNAIAAHRIVTLGAGLQRARAATHAEA